MLVNSFELKKLSLHAFKSSDDGDKLYQNDFRKVKYCINSNIEVYFIVDKIDNNIITFKYYTNNNFTQEFIEDLYDNYLKPYIIDFKDNTQVIMNLPEDIMFYLKLKDLLWKMM